MTVKILIVDDETDLELVVRQKFRKQIKDKSYEFYFAHHGGEAIEQLQAHPEIDLILSDINMPVMDGLTLLAKIRDLDPIMKTVIVSAYGDMTNIRTAMNRGAFDFLTKPIDFQDFEITITKTAEQSASLREAIKIRDKLLAVQHELNVATSIQQSILPRTFPPFPGRKEFDLFAEMHPAKEVGGDFYDFFLINENQLGIVIADVSGKGVPAAIFMAMSRMLLKSTALRGGAPGDCLREVNDMLVLNNDSAMFVTVFYAILDTRTGELSWTSGGHNPPYILGQDRVEQLRGETGTVVGVMDDLDFATDKHQLFPGEGLLLYTDGITEAMDPQDVLFGEPRLEVVLKEAGAAPPRTLTENVVRAVKSFANGAPQSDDITLLALRYAGRP